jgi:hypothetical protein
MLFHVNMIEPHVRYHLSIRYYKLTCLQLLQCERNLHLHVLSIKMFDFVACNCCYRHFISGYIINIVPKWSLTETKKANIHI